MKALTMRQWEGISSLAWTLIGFEFFRYWSTHRGFQSPFSVVFIVLGLWWGVSLLLALSGLRSHSLVGVLTGGASIIGFLWFFWVVFQG
jgi:hypothetical protein